MVSGIQDKKVSWPKMLNARRESMMAFLGIILHHEIELSQYVLVHTVI